MVKNQVFVYREVGVLGKIVSLIVEENLNVLILLIFTVKMLRLISPN